MPQRAKPELGGDRLRRLAAEAEELEDRVPGEEAVGVLEVDCPKCGELAGDPCITPKGKPAKRQHAARVAAAAERAAELEGGDEPLEGDELVPDRIAGRRWRELYLACRRALEAREDWTLLVATFLEGMVVELAEAENAIVQAAKTPVVVGSTGQDVAHPLYATERGLRAQALATAKALRLLPEVAPGAGGEATPADPLAELDRQAREDELEARRNRRAG